MAKKPANKSHVDSTSREHCFVIISFDKKYDNICKQICCAIEVHTGLQCLPANRRPEPGRGLLEKVHEMILGASVVVADVTEHNANVYYEYGYASAHNRLPILIARKGAKLPTDLVGKETLRYRDEPESDPQFMKKFLSCIDQQLRSPLPEQRRMLASPSPFPAYVIASPREPGPRPKNWWHPSEKHTFGDMMGISGILTAYGNLFGAHRLPELLHARCLSDDVLRKSASFFCIGSSKMNKATEHFLELIQSGLTPQWKMPQIGTKQEKRVFFTRADDPEINKLLKIRLEETPNGFISDYGLIIRAPLPGDPRHFVIIAAGRHSIGTHAASMMITHPKLIADLERALKKSRIKLQNTSEPFWAIVRGTVHKNGGFAEKIEIIKSGGYTKRIIS